MLTTVHHSQPYLITTEDALMASFREKDQKHVVLPRDLAYPLAIQHFISWSESSNTYTYLVYKRPNWDAPRGMVFRRTTVHPVTTNICDWCHSYGSSDDIGMLSVRVSPKLTVGQYLCLDLNCLDKIETQIGSTGKNFDTLAEQVCEKVNRFFEKTIMAAVKAT